MFVYIRFWDVEDNALMDREERLRTKTVQRLTPPSFVHRHDHDFLIPIKANQPMTN